MRLWDSKTSIWINFEWNEHSHSLIYSAKKKWFVNILFGKRDAVWFYPKKSTTFFASVKLGVRYDWVFYDSINLYLNPVLSIASEVALHTHSTAQHRINGITISNSFKSFHFQLETAVDKQRHSTKPVVEIDFRFLCHRIDNHIFQLESNNHKIIIIHRVWNGNRTKLIQMLNVN